MAARPARRSDKLSLRTHRSSDSSDREAVSGAVQALAALDTAELRARWLALKGAPAPKSFRRNLLRRALAHEMQVAAFGGLPTATQRRLRELAKAARDDRFDQVFGASPLKPGTLLLRVWQGQTHRVMVARDGYIWNGDSYGSLSTIAKLISGTNWNGWTFFGLKRPTSRNKNAAKSGSADDEIHREEGASDIGRGTHNDTGPAAPSMAVEARIDGGLINARAG